MNEQLSDNESTTPNSDNSNGDQNPPKKPERK